ncbi:hypothetical protein HNP46_000454 [Pseudomonas nitritireducens]|uniref:Uncharacterized protein n=1 Tax=Pseudomonas nitroreducens TaxID=46680 RepID=A0A7W7KG38_PSENT|nr:hypothetical protein [Pseudomonas nitritireducens]MBB4861643.1 hypothetical protein [Pseudomonas nitritireducens]
MGGNALAEFGARRVSKDEASKQYEIVSRVIGSLAGAEPPYRHEMVRAYRAKKDFGDLDVLVDRKLFATYPTEEILSAFEAAVGQKLPYHKNGPCLSIGLPLDEGYLQVDLISSPAHEFDFTRGYFAWNDLGNLMGRIAHKMGLVLGHDALRLPIRDKTHLFKEVVITRDFNQAIELLGYDPKRYNEGFDTLQDIYEFATSTPKFDPQIYALENRNHTARVRDKKRPVYTAFLTWLDEHKGQVPEFQWNEDKLVYLPEVFAKFPAAEKEYKAAYEEYHRNKAMASKFNGNVVAEVTGYQGKELGEFIQHFRKRNADLFERLESLTDEDIREAIRGENKRYKADTGPSLG